MVQRIDRQIKESGIEAQLTVATSVTQYDPIVNQMSSGVSVVTEPERRDTFPAIALSTCHLAMQRGCSRDEVVVVMPSDSYIERGYFDTISKMAEAVERGVADIVLMGIKPTYSSTEFGYIVPNKATDGEEFIMVDRFMEKPSEEVVEELLSQHAYWNGGVFAFRLGYVTDIVERYIQAESFDEIRSRYGDLPKISFDYEVVERAKSIALVPYSGSWSDLGTWSNLSDKIDAQTLGNVVADQNVRNSHILNELDIPIVALGVEDLVIAASPDGILVSTKESSSNLKSYVDKFTSRPMYEERRWGKYRVMGHEHFEDGHNALTKLLHINAGCNISYQYHNYREEIWTFVDGEGLLILDGERIEVSRGYVAHIKPGQRHAVRAITDLQIIEVQAGTDLVEEDIIRLEWEW